MSLGAQRTSEHVKFASVVVVFVVTTVQGTGSDSGALPISTQRISLVGIAVEGLLADGKLSTNVDIVH